MKISGKACFPVFLVICISLTTAFSLDAPVTLPVITLDGREYISLHSLIESLGVDNSFDIITRRGKLYRGSSVFVYQLGMSTVLSNGLLEKFAYPVIGRNGDILFPVKTAGSFLEKFYPALHFVREQHRFILTAADSLPGKDIQPGRAGRTEKPTEAARKDKISFIIIDAGHGGKDPGAIGRGGAKEKSITLVIALKLEKYLKENIKGVRIILTRKSDRFLELSKRTDIANSYLKENQNGLFISIHINASLSPRISGFETYFLSQNASNEDARATAALENNVIILEDPKRKKSYDDVEHIEAFMYTTQVLKESSLLAETIQAGLDSTIREFKARGVKKADFFVLRGSLMPAVLVEAGYITNEKESAMLRKDAYQDKIAKGIGSGTAAFLKKYNEMIKK